jgi:tRNA threonylcarbamoyladenosine biosynthesis protein TsaE
MRLTAASEDEMVRLGARLAPLLRGGLVVTLSGPLGAGKTTLVRAILRSLGHTGGVKSPSYTLVESYPVAGLTIHHFDFYRLADPGELEELGLRDYLEPDAVCLIEWPERGAGLTPRADVRIQISPVGPIREIEITAVTTTGQGLLENRG